MTKRSLLVILKTMPITTDFIKSVEDLFDEECWETLYTFHTIDEATIDKYMPKYTKKIWTIITKEQHLSKDFIKEHRHKVDWDIIKAYYNFDNKLEDGDFIRFHERFGAQEEESSYKIRPGFLSAHDSDE